MRTTFILALLILFSFPAFSGELPSLTIKDYLAKKNSIPEAFEIDGYVNKIFTCPVCPAGAQCKPCSNYMVLSDSPACDTSTATSCPDSMYYPVDYPNNYAGVTPGTEIKIKAEVKTSLNVVSILSPKQKEDSKKYQKILKNTLDKDPNLEPTKRPGWLKDIPGESYQINK